MHVESSLGRRAALVAAALALSVLVSSCVAAPTAERQTPTSTPNAADRAVTVPDRSQDQIYLFSPWDQQLTAYDLEAERVEATSGGGQLYYYGFPTASSLYTVGDTEALGFRVVDAQPTEVRTVATPAPNEAVFPLATDGTHTFFVVYEYEAPGVESGRRIVRLTEDGDLETYGTFEGMKELVDKGVLVGDVLHYSVYDAEQDEHSVFSLPADEPGAEPTLVRSGLASGELYAAADTVLFSDGTTIIGGDHSYECAAMCWFYEDPAVLLRIAAENSELVLSVIDWRTGVVLERVPGIVGFDVAGAELTAYTDGRVEVVSLGEAEV